MMSKDERALGYLILGATALITLALMLGISVAAGLGFLAAFCIIMAIPSYLKLRKTWEAEARAKRERADA